MESAAESSSHPLNYAYAFWYFKKVPGISSSDEFEKCLVKLGEFDSVEGFWAIYSHLARLSDLPIGSEYFVFKVGIKPMWEDESNRKGGKWLVRIKKAATSRCWENVLLAMVGEQFGVSAGDELCGCVVSVKGTDDSISVWNRTANNKDATTRIRDVLKETLDIPVNGAFDYKAHTVSLHHVGAAGGAEGGATGHHQHQHHHHLQRHGSGEGHSGERGVMQRRFSNDAHDGE